MVFQNYALYPYLTVAANIGFPLRIARVPKAERAKRVARGRGAARADASTCTASRASSRAASGSASRWAARSSAQPSVFLMDEPLSNLDAKLRVQMRADIAALQAELGVTTVYVTHDQSEAMTLGHRVAVLQDGSLQQCDTPRVLYDRPVNTFVAGFIGSPAMNLCTVPVANGAVVARRRRPVPLPAASANGRAERRARPAAGGARARGGRARRPRCRSSRSSARTRSSSASPRSAARQTKLVARVDARRAPRAASASRCARARPRRTSSSRTAARAWPKPPCPAEPRLGPGPSTKPSRIRDHFVTGAGQARPRRPAFGRARDTSVTKA